ncbi:hypothetical protein MJG53_016944 [Ovis ammon polii x Ovis aries]|uniref:Cathepsin W n=2 Tax=Ovis TaxID=9935 RepID=A0AAD4TP53_OVIAM|nr:hypothetical protein MG293_019993 [Ovis ammon polii]KAI4553339.1 hypothetical protein MJT46_016633 [Ovis ammon polii x Ovis aries]KAI4561890.1 hypothetical protein MJG53_016944 [Ovis ammon polii x Ovis aries]
MQYNRSYPNPAEHARRLDIFAQNLAKAQRLQEEDLGTAEFGVTQFSDLTELLDCDRCGNGCKGGFVWDAFLTVLKNSIARHLATQGPITVTINVKLLQQYQKGVIKATPTTCDPRHVDHSVLLVGFGKTKSVEGRQGKAASFRSYTRPRRSMAYWTLKNSWGPHWGEEGYFRLHRGSNTCGITKYPVTAIVDIPKKKQQVSCPP